MFANDIGIDLGTATTLIYIAGKGIVLREPSIVAMDERNGQVLAVGDEAYTMLGKTASDIRVVRPLEDGVISDYEVTEQMLKHFFAKVNPSRVFKPRVCVCVPSAITEVESRSVIDTVMSSGARNVYLIEEPVAAAIGAGMDITRPGGIVVLDIGGGTSDIAVLSLNGIVCKSSVKMAGNKMNAAIVRYVRSTYNVLIGDSTADRVKREIGTVWTEGQPEKTVEVKGRNLVTGLPQKITLSSYELEMPLRTFNQGQNAKFAPTFEEELQPTLVAKGPGAIQSGYTVRRLTPTECARLQGFPDNWCADLGTEKPTDEEMYFWHKVFKTYSEVTGCKMKSDKQVAKWLKDPYSDSAEYKMWGNGVALPCVWFVLCGIVWYAQSGGDNAPI